MKEDFLGDDGFLDSQARSTVIYTLPSTLIFGQKGPYLEDSLFQKNGHIP